ncbi:histidine phosphatase family protein [Falsirhodobacter halotolerans]|nr:histidine phosphatase family protein [Falsirhodobacter halotolerans]MCJ8138555.1 histidine phosphatase family protein [Falsirhodobacter halotolerans]
MPRLILIRHAKSGWDDPLMTDHQRPLAERGERAAPQIGAWLAAQGVLPEEVLCSDATRTRQTWDLISTTLPGAPTPRLVPALYHAAPETMLRVLQGATGQVVAMIGHNPGIAEFARLIVARAPEHSGFARYPTAATLVAEFDADWAAVRFGAGRTVAFTTPRDLG